jgi:hypothetical protein
MNDLEGSHMANITNNDVFISCGNQNVLFLPVNTPLPANRRMKIEVDTNVATVIEIRTNDSSIATVSIPFDDDSKSSNFVDVVGEFATDGRILIEFYQSDSGLYFGSVIN